jgi:hypothetical protein
MSWRTERANDFEILERNVLRKERQKQLSTTSATKPRVLFAGSSLLFGWTSSVTLQQRNDEQRVERNRLKKAESRVQERESGRLTRRCPPQAAGAAGTARRFDLLLQLQ